MSLRPMLILNKSQIKPNLHTRVKVLVVSCSMIDSTAVDRSRRTGMLSITASHMCRHSGRNHAENKKFYSMEYKKTEIVIVGDSGQICDTEGCHSNDEFISDVLLQ